MNAEQHIERDLPTILDDLATGPYPEYIDDVLIATAAVRQRRAWALLERWFPMDFAARPVPAPMVPWRQFGVAALLILLLAIPLAMYVGSRPARPLPFGVATNGLVAYAFQGDIYAADPVSGRPRRLTDGPDLDRDPLFSPDGTRIGFLRESNIDGRYGYDIAVMAADGSGLRVITQEPIIGLDFVDWAPDSARLAVVVARAPDPTRLLMFDATRTAAPRIVAEGLAPGSVAFRPPDGAQILFRRQDYASIGLYVIDADGSGERPLIEPHVASSVKDLVGARWSPDGSQVAFVSAPGCCGNDPRVFIVNADGSGLGRLVQEPGGVGIQVGSSTDVNPVWSPDGTRIAVERREWVADVGWVVQPIGIVRVSDGVVIDASRDPATRGMHFGWAPDGSSIVTLPVGKAVRPQLIQVDRATSTELDFVTDSALSWQRLAP